jgi:transcriptional regulator with XRE-family HTH domain
MKTRERETARRLRRDEGRSIKEIARRVGVSVSSVSRWVRDIELTDQQVERLRLRNSYYNPQFAAWKASSEQARERRRRYQDDGRRLARLGAASHAAGVMLYWAEGDKTNRNCVRFSNADPYVMRVFLEFLRAYFDVPNSRVRITCHLFADHVSDQRAIEQFWLDFLTLPRARLCPSVVNVYSKYSEKKRRNKLPYGTCRLVVCDTRIVQSIFGSIQEYGGFERPEWLG